MYQKTDLENRLRIVTERIDHVKSASLGVWVNVGSRDELSGEEGISHLLEHMIFKGTARRSALEIAKEIDQIGGMSNAFTSKEFTCFHAKVMSDHLPLVADLLTDIFLHSRFAEDDLEKELQVILQEIHMVEDTPDELVHVLFAQQMWPDDPLGRPVMGTMESVAAIGPQDIRRYLARTYLPPRIVISAAGDIHHQEVVDLVAPAFTKLPGDAAPEESLRPKAATGVKVYSKKLEQVHLCLGAEFPDVMDPKRYTAALLNVLLGGNMSSRLFQEIREKRGLAYSVFSFFSAYLNTGVLGVYAGVEPKQAVETVELILAELTKFRNGELSGSELKAAQEHLKGSIILGSESVDNRMTRLAKNELTYRRNIEFDEVLATINHVTADQVISLANEYLQPEKLALTILGPVDEQDFPGDLLS
ncbi:MAG: insulinase family protein [Deltaproteobacteria bacterium]|nr:insulinase family protein [Deltaproteobacteria bacterium]